MCKEAAEDAARKNQDTMEVRVGDEENNIVPVVAARGAKANGLSLSATMLSQEKEIND
jgi:hypothetical protein